MPADAGAGLVFGDESLDEFGLRDVGEPCRRGPQRGQPVGERIGLSSPGVSEVVPGYERDGPAIALEPPKVKRGEVERAGPVDQVFLDLRRDDGVGVMQTGRLVLARHGTRPGKSARVSVMASAQLAILAAAPVDSGDDDAAVTAGLAGHAGGDAGDRATPRLRDGVAAFDAVLGPFAGGQASARGQDAVEDGVVYLIQNRSVAGLTSSHLGLRFLCGDNEMGNPVAKPSVAAADRAALSVEAEKPWPPTGTGLKGNTAK